MAEHIEKLAQRLAQVNADIKSLEAAIEAEGRSANAEENAKRTALNAEFEAINADINLRNKSAERDAALSDLSAPVPRKVDPGPISTTAAIPILTTTHTFSGGTPVAHNYANHGFVRGEAEFLMAVRNAATTRRVDPRLMVNAVTTYGGETVGGDGGYLAPPQFASGMMALVVPQDSFVNALRPVQTTSSMLTIPTDEDAPWASTGITVAKTAEAGTITASKPKITKLNIVMHAIKGLVSVTNEMLKDVSFIGSFVQQKMAQKLRWKVENYCINGTGEDEPLGVLNSPGLYTLSSDIESSTTILGALDLFAIKANALGGPGGFWVVHPAVRTQIWGLKSDATAGYPLYVFDAQVAPGGRLLGDPMFHSQACKAYNTVGDILYIEPDGYVLAFEAGGVQQATSIEWAFDQDLTSYRATLRMGGSGTLSNKLTRADGSTYTSNLIALAARS